MNKDQSDRELSESLASYFIQITDEFTPLDMDSLPRTYDSPYPIVLPHETAARIKSGKNHSLQYVAT